VSGANTSPCLMVIMDPFPGVLRPESGNNHSLHIAEFKNEWSYKSTLPCAFITCKGTTLTLVAELTEGPEESRKHFLYNWLVSRPNTNLKWKQYCIPSCKTVIRLYLHRLIITHTQRVRTDAAALSKILRMI
jgi:hypothetical protein